MLAPKTTRRCGVDFVESLGARHSPAACHRSVYPPNPGSAFTVREDGSWEIRPGYWFWMQVCRTGQPGMSVVRTSAMDSEIALLGFAGNNTGNPDAFVLVNLGRKKKVRVRIRGTSAVEFTARRTWEDGTEYFFPNRYLSLGQRRDRLCSARRFDDDVFRQRIAGDSTFMARDCAGVCPADQLLRWKPPFTSVSQTTEPSDVVPPLQTTAREDVVGGR